MRSYRAELTLEAPSRRAFVNITRKVEDAVAASGVRDGLCLVNAMHITASVFVNDESGLHRDFDRWLERLAPHEPVSGYAHNETGEDNADAHLKRQTMGRKVVVAMTDDRLDLGTWEQGCSAEQLGRTGATRSPVRADPHDCRRKKRVLVKIIGA